MSVIMYFAVGDILYTQADDQYHGVLSSQYMITFTVSLIQLDGAACLDADNNTPASRDRSDRLNANPQSFYKIRWKSSL